MSEAAGSAPQPVPETERMWSPSYRLLTAGLLLVVSAAVFESLAVATILPMVVCELGGLELYGWAFSLFPLANLLGITLAGSAADRRGPALPLAVGIGVFIVGLVAGGLAPTMPVLIASRAIQGFGSGLLTAAVYVAIGRSYADTLRARMLASLSSASACCLAQKEESFDQGVRGVHPDSHGPSTPQHRYGLSHGSTRGRVSVKVVPAPTVLCTAT